MKKIIIITIIIFITIIIIIISRQEALLTPVIPSPAPSLTPSPTPKLFKYDASTDLEKELESVDPKVLDSDFNE